MRRAGQSRPGEKEAKGGVRLPASLTFRASAALPAPSEERAEFAGQARPANRRRARSAFGAESPFQPPGRSGISRTNKPTPACRQASPRPSHLTGTGARMGPVRKPTEAEGLPVEGPSGRPAEADFVPLRLVLQPAGGDPP